VHGCFYLTLTDIGQLVNVEDTGLTPLKVRPVDRYHRCTDVEAADSEAELFDAEVAHGQRGVSNVRSKTPVACR
jgi:hypothetical protein